MSAHLTSFSYDGDAASEGAPKGVRSQSMLEVSDAEMDGNVQIGGNGGDTKQHQNIVRSPTSGSGSVRSDSVRRGGRRG